MLERVEDRVESWAHDVEESVGSPQPYNWRVDVTRKTRGSSLGILHDNSEPSNMIVAISSIVFLLKGILRMITREEESKSTSTVTCLPNFHQEFPQHS